jgi:phosphate transport system substrate-binding protein
LRPAADLLAQEYGQPERHVVVTVSEGSIEEVLEAVALGQADVALLGRPLEGAEALNPVDGRPWLRAWPLASDVVAIAVHPSNPVQGLDATQLRRMYEGLERRWDQLGGPDEPIRLVSREPGAPARAVFEGAFLAGTHIAGSAVIMPGDEAVRDYVAEHPEAIGYLSLAWADDTVKVVALDGVRPSPTAAIVGRYPLTHPIVAVARIGPAGKVRAFLGFCLSAEGLKALGEHYAPPTHSQRP